jgi:small acid-soluble spore protein L (minor)
MEILTLLEVRLMSKKNNGNRGVKAPGVNPQGYGQDAEFSEDPKSKLENAAKKSNTRR